MAVVESSALKAALVPGLEALNTAMQLMELYFESIKKGANKSGNAPDPEVAAITAQWPALKVSITASITAVNSLP